MNRQVIIIETNEGSAHSEEQLKDIWEIRLKEIAPYYKVKSVKIEEHDVSVSEEGGTWY